MCGKGAVLVAAELGALEQLGEQGDSGVDVCFLCLIWNISVSILALELRK